MRGHEAFDCPRKKRMSSLFILAATSPSISFHLVISKNRIPTVVRATVNSSPQLRVGCLHHVASLAACRSRINRGSGLVTATLTANEENFPRMGEGSEVNTCVSAFASFAPSRDTGNGSIIGVPSMRHARDH